MPSLKESDVDIVIAKKENALPHTHDFLEFAYVTKGKCEHYLNGEKRTLSSGDFFIIDYGAMHGYEVYNDEDFELINVIFKPRVIDKTLSSCRNFTDLMNHYLLRINDECVLPSPSNRVYFDDDGEILGVVNRITGEFFAKKPGYMAVIRSLIIELIILTARKIDRNYSYGDVAGYMLKSANENYARPETLNEIAEKFNYSVPYLSQKFLSAYGIGYRDYVVGVKLNEAARLIANSDDKIYEIAKLVGYEDLNFFYSSFKKRFGVSPAKYRKTSG